MAVPVAEALKDRYPAFLGVPNERVDIALADAARQVDDSWIEADREPAILALAAHLLTVEGHGTGAGGSAGPVASQKVGDVAVTFHAHGEAAIKAGKPGSDLHTTSYGRRWLDFLRRNAPWIIPV